LAGLGVDMWFSGWGSSLGASENGLGVISFLATGSSDFLIGYTDINLQTGTIKIGKDTIVSSRNMLFGQIPESNIDAWISLSQAKYDTDRILGYRSGDSYEVMNNWQVNGTNLLGAGLQFYFFDWW
jgi:hypothetical protein